MRKLLATILIALIVFPPPAFAALGAKTAWNVAAGSDTNGGGCDYGATGSVCGTVNDDSLGAGVAITVTLASGTTGTASPAFSSTTHGPGNLVYIASGTGTCTVGWYDINSQAAGTATFDKTMGTTGDVCTGTIGGPLATITQAYTNAVAGNTVNLKKATYTATSPLAPNCVDTEGYNSTIGDLLGTWLSSNRPSITTATNSTVLMIPPQNCQSAGYQMVLRNLILSNTAATRAPGIQPSAPNITLLADGVTLSGFTYALDGNTNNDFHLINFINSEATGITKCFYYPYSAGALNVNNSYFHDSTAAAPCATGLLSLAAGYSSITIDRTIFYNITGNMAGVETPSSSFHMTNSICYAVSGICINGTNSGTTMYLANNVMWGGGTGLTLYHPYTTTGQVSQYNDAYGSNTHDTDSAATSKGVGFITLTADPFVDAAHGNFALNNDAGGGALLKAAGYPTVLAGGGTATSNDVGAAQAAGSSGSGITVYGCEE